MWTVVLTFDAQPRQILLDWEEGLVELEATVASVPGVESTLTLHVDGDDLAGALEDCLTSVRAAVQGEPIAVEAMSDEVYERRANTPTLPSLVSAPEVGDLLGGVSRQRVHQLQQNPAFPEPLFRLRTGPIWDERAIARFVATWDRKPGRPPTVSAAG